MFAPDSSNKNADEPKSGRAAGKRQLPIVKVITMEPASLTQTLQVTGSVLANEEVSLMSEISGRITALNFREGANVSKGALLVKINDADLRATFKKLRVQEALALKDERRSKTLLDQDLLSNEEYDAALNKLESLRADLEKLQSDLAKTEIRAPFSGTVGLRSVSNGSTVTPATLIARVQQMDPVKVEFTIPERHAGSVRVGSPITFNVAGLDREFTGRVYAMEPKIDAATRTLRLRALAANPGRVLVPGAFAKVRLELSRVENAISIPTSSIVPHIDGQKVFVLKGGKAISQNIMTGVRSDTSVQVLDGLQAGDTVITSGLLQLREGAMVQVSQ